MPGMIDLLAIVDWMIGQLPEKPPSLVELVDLKLEFNSTPIGVLARTVTVANLHLRVCTVVPVCAGRLWRQPPRSHAAVGQVGPASRVRGEQRDARHHKHHHAVQRARVSPRVSQ
jgi:hypothetical protein